MEVILIVEKNHRSESTKEPFFTFLFQYILIERARSAFCDGLRQFTFPFFFFSSL